MEESLEPAFYDVDASLHGFGVAASQWSSDEVAQVARTPETSVEIVS